MKKNKIATEPRFSLRHRGYDIDSVEAYIKSEKDKSDAVLSEQRERILSLRDQLEHAAEVINDYREREEDIKKSIISATEKANYMTADVRLRYGIELDRLNLFRTKWTGAYAELKERYHFDKDALNVESVALCAKMELERFLSRDFSLSSGAELPETEKQFRSEAERLGRGESGVAELRDKFLSATKKKTSEQPAAFSLEEAAHPEESLEDICRSIGIKGKYN